MPFRVRRGELPPGLMAVNTEDRSRSLPYHSGELQVDRACPRGTWQPLHRVAFAMRTAVRRIISFYRDGFRSMTVGRSLWKIIIVKVVFMMVVLKLFFFPDFLKVNFTDDEQRADYVLRQMHDPARAD